MYLFPAKPATPAEALGNSFNFKGQRYEYTGSREIEVPAKRVTVYQLRSRCPDCGAAFTVSASARQIQGRSLNRRCRDCRKPGRRVKP